MTLSTFRDDLCVGRVALVSGGTSGIGAGIAQGLAAFGAAVGCVDMSAAGLDATVQAGHRFVLPRGFVGTWEVVVTTRKLYVIHEVSP